MYGHTCGDGVGAGKTLEPGKRFWQAGRQGVLQYAERHSTNAFS